MIDLGDTKRLIALTTDPTGLAADVATMTVTVTLPDGTSSSPSVTHAGTGSYYADFATTQAGRHTVLWTGTGDNPQTYADEFDVAAADPGYIISLEQARRAVGLPATNTAKDEDLRDYLAAVTPIMEDLVGAIRSTARDEWHDGGSAAIRLLYAPVLSVTTVHESYGPIYRTLTEQTLDGAGGFDAYGYTVDKTDGRIQRRASGMLVPFPTGRRNVHVTYTSGRTTPLSGNLLLATRRLLRHLWQQEQQGLRPDFGSPENPIAYTPSGYAVPKAVVELCADSVRAVNG
jgi:hypothetical protein